jgi:predicted Co/Zn/Cd cation transporter (cation efflux family)
MNESYKRKELLLLKVATGLTVFYAMAAVMIAVISDSMTLFLDSAYSVIDMSTSTALGLAILLLILYYPVLKLWDKAGGEYSLEWLLNKIISTFSRETVS